MRSGEISWQTESIAKNRQLTSMTHSRRNGENRRSKMILRSSGERFGRTCGFSLKSHSSSPLPATTDILRYFIDNWRGNRPFLPSFSRSRAERKKIRNFFETPLATRGADVTIIIVPPYDAFGDWATPKEPAAELFLRSPIQTSSSADPPLANSPTQERDTAARIPIARC